VRALEERSAALLGAHREIESWPPFLFIGEPARRFFLHSAGRVAAGTGALGAAIEAERGTSRFYEEHAARFEVSEGKAVFEARAAAERQHLARLIRAQRQLRPRR
jgi:hypothetical protein